MQGLAWSLDFVVHGNLSASEATKELQARIETFGNSSNARWSGVG